MEKVSHDEVDAEPHAMGVNSVRLPLSDAVGAEHVAVVRYELEPCEQFSGERHTHHDREELFYVLSGTATFEVGREGDERVAVGPGELVRFAPGEFQCGRNESDERVVGLAVAAPGARHDWDEIESVAPCGDCGEATPHGVRDPGETDEFVVRYLECGTETRVA